MTGVLSRIAARHIRETVDALLSITPIERIMEVEPICARLIEVSVMLDPPAAPTVEGDALLHRIAGGGSIRRLDRAMSVQNQSLSDRRLK